MSPEEFNAAYPKLRAWIQKTLAAYETRARPVVSKHFARLPLYFDDSLLTTAKFVAVDRLPMPPLSAMGLDQFSAFEKADFDGITYLDTYFLKPALLNQESLHFHELVHVIQWHLLGPGGFLLAYANGLEQFGYQDCPLEKMAYEAEVLFTQQAPVFSAAQFVTERILSRQK